MLILWIKLFLSFLIQTGCVWLINGQAFVAFVKERVHNAVEIDILEFLDGYPSLQIWPPRKILLEQILQAQMTSLQSTMCVFYLTFSLTCRPAQCLSSVTFCEVLTTCPVEKTSP